MTKKIFFQTYLALFLIILLGLFLAFTHINRPPAIATVNITAIIHQFAKAEAKRHLPPPALKKAVNEFALQLTPVLNAIAKEHHVVLVFQEAVLAGSLDFTPLVKERLRLDDAEEKDKFW